MVIVWRKGEDREMDVLSVEVEASELYEKLKEVFKVFVNVSCDVQPPCFRNRGKVEGRVMAEVCVSSTPRLKRSKIGCRTSERSEGLTG